MKNIQVKSESAVCRNGSLFPMSAGAARLVHDIHCKYFSPFSIGVHRVFGRAAGTSKNVTVFFFPDTDMPLTYLTYFCVWCCRRCCCWYEPPSVKHFWKLNLRSVWRLWRLPVHTQSERNTTTTRSRSKTVNFPCKLTRKEKETLKPW